MVCPITGLRKKSIRISIFTCNFTDGSIRIKHRIPPGRSLLYSFEDSSCRLTGEVVILDNSSKIQFHLQSLREIHIQIGTEIIAFGTYLSIVIIQVRMLVHSTLIQKGYGYIVTNGTATTRYIDIGLSFEWGFPQQLFLPVYIRIQILVSRVTAITELLNILIRICCIIKTIILQTFSVKLQSIIWFQIFRQSGRIQHCLLHININARLTLRSSFRSNNHNSIRTTHSIYGCGRSIFQDRNTFYFIRVDITKSAFNAIYNN